VSHSWAERCVDGGHGFAALVSFDLLCGKFDGGQVNLPIENDVPRDEGEHSPDRQRDEPGATTPHT
jgi:hypothetical protein